MRIVSVRASIFRAATYAAVIVSSFTIAAAAGDKKSQSDNPSTEAAAISAQADRLARERARIAEQLAQAEKEKQDEDDESPVQAAISVLQSIDAVYLQHEERVREQRHLQDETNDLDRQATALDKFGPDEPQPYSFLLLDGLKDQLSVEKEREHALENEAKSAKKLLKAAKEDMDQIGRDVPTPPRAGATGAPQPAASLQRRLNADELQELLGRARVGLKETEVDVGQTRLHLCKTRQQFLKNKIALVEKKVVFSTQDRDAERNRLAAAKSRLERQKNDLQLRLQEIDAERRQSRSELEGAKASPSVIDAAAAAWRITGETLQSEMLILDEHSESVANLGRAWRRRYELSTGTVHAETLRQWRSDLDSWRDDIDAALHSLEHRRDTLHADQTASATMDANADNPAIGKSREALQAALEETRARCDDSIVDLKAAQRMLVRFREEIDAKLPDSSDFSSLGAAALSLWATPIAGDTEHAVTLGTLLTLSACILAGIAIAYLLSRVIFHRLLPRLGMQRGTASALRSILFYSLCALFGVLAFRVLHIPVAAFAFLGGAAAIAVGFGSQDIMNNFMSGVILLTEQPIRVGDFVQLEGIQGYVLHIGLRSTRIQTEMNHELIVPNKALIDEPVTNLTLSDNLVQLTVAATLDRDVKIQEAKWEMMKIVFSHPLVLKSPRPLVLLKEVDNYWLVFEVHFWLQYSSFARSALVQSEILEQIGDRYSPPAETKTSSSESTSDVAASQSEDSDADAIERPADVVASADGASDSEEQPEPVIVGLPSAGDKSAEPHAGNGVDPATDKRAAAAMISPDLWATIEQMTNAAVAKVLKRARKAAASVRR